MNIRKANPDDAAALFAIKQSLPLPSLQTESVKGGFLLGTDEKTYRAYIQISYCLVAENADGVKGFGIIFPDAVIRQAEIWQKRQAIRWSADITGLEEKTLCYIEQLAFLPGYRKWSSPLCYQLLKGAFDAGCEYMLTTIVRKPVHNKAAVPLIEAVGGKLIGNIDEEYPAVGTINSDVYGIAREDFFAKTVEHPMFQYVLDRLAKEPVL